MCECAGPTQMPDSLADWATTMKEVVTEELCCPLKTDEEFGPAQP